ncbi:MAG: UDP-3-O-[3-hydroxymyristoyl] N-acetylglucosamine deacetylase [Halanaerobiales bacterium]|nr:UDP-3-O-[3-hydroxymyristoyl] N-acetylglucosamine deacetylase [Halanaerobiales bacterium]
MEQAKIQQTLVKPVSYTGISLHTGKDVTITCRPASLNTGISFRRIDLPGQPIIKVTPNNIISTKRCTSIGSIESNLVIHTIEHLMAAISMTGIDNLEIEIDSEEPPVTDGSAIVFMNLLKGGGIVEQEGSIKMLQIREPLFVKENDATLVALPYDGFRISYTLSYTHQVIGTQYADYMITNEIFEKEIASARTFGFQREVETLHKRGLALGGSLENAVLIGDDKIINSLRFSNEFVRHKILDMVGDLAVNGRVQGHFIGIKSGHSLNANLSQLIFSQNRG